MFGIVVAFKDINFTKGIFASDWIGFKNFEFLFQSNDAFIITRNTILYNVAFIVINTAVPIMIAIMLSIIGKKFFQRLFQSLILLPYLISMVIVSYLVYAFFNADYGMLNKSILPALGIDPVIWYSESKYWPFILILVNTWKSAGYQCIIFLSTIIGIDKSYYEAATIDGATVWQQITKITLPLLKPTIIVLVFLGIGKIFYSDFGLFYQVPMNSGILYPTTDVIDTYVYRTMMVLGDFGMSSAAGLFQSVIGFVLVLVSNILVRRISPEDALF